MTAVNYMRVLLKAECKDCEWKGYDTECENTETYLIHESENGSVYASSLKYQCPSCKGSNIEIENFNQYIQ